MDAETHKKLRAPFAPDNVGKLPRVWCGKCREAIKNRRPACDDHQRAKCQVCSNNMTTAHLHLDYIGHAAITDRLLQVDHFWVWEPVAFDDAGLPALDRNGGLWIRLTVAGVTRLGYGDAEGKTGPAAVKEAIGDALRNAAMRFGVGLDLWHKDGSLAQDDEPAPAQRQEKRPPERATNSVVEARKRLAAIIAENNWSLDLIAARYKTETKHDLGAATDAAVVEKFTNDLFAHSDHELGRNGATA
jgi:hypothetical protein